MQISRITEVPEVGKVYTSTVKKIMDFGVFVEFLPGKEGLVHVSQLDVKRVANPADVCKVGDVFEVKIVDKDDQGRWKLSRKAVLAPMCRTSVLLRRNVKAAIGRTVTGVRRTTAVPEAENASP